MYSNLEKVDMLLIFGECRKNATAATNLYAQRFPHRQHPSRHYFPNLVRRMQRDPDEEREQFIVDEDTEITVLAYVEAHMTASIREIVRECDVSYGTAWRILRKHKYRSYKYQLHQHLYENDSERRLAYCNWYLEKQNQDPNFPSKILYSDESRFTNLGMFNRNNKRYWAKENLHLMEEGNFQERFGFNVWLGILGERIIGPIIFDGHLTGIRYREFLEQIFQDIPENEDIYFQQDGAPPHNARIVSDLLNEQFEGRWLGTYGPIRWAPRSPDLTPLDAYAWGTIKDEVFITPVRTREELEQRVRASIARIQNSPGELRRVIINASTRVRFCRQMQGGHFEHLLNN